MSEVTLAAAETHLEKWLAADEAVSRGQQYSMGTFSLSRADTDQIRQQIGYWERRIKDLRAQAAAPAGSYARSQPGVSVARVR